MHKIYQNSQIGKSLKVRCLEQGLSKTLSILIVLISLGTKFRERIKLTIVVVSFTGEIVLVTKIILERQVVMLKYNGMNTKTKIANLNQLSI